jgi:undecaprenyl-diphosphatase
VATREGIAEDDRPLLSWLVAHRDGAWTGVMAGISSTGVIAAAVVVALVLVAGIAARSRSWRPLATVVLALGGSATAGVILKSLVRRSRPPVATMLGAPETGWGFPSNHTLVTAALAGGLVLVVWRVTRHPLARAAVAVVAATASLAMGASRLYLGDHWLTDVLASFALAVGVVAVVAWMTGPAGELLLRRTLRRRA